MTRALALVASITLVVGGLSVPVEGDGGEPAVVSPGQHLALPLYTEVTDAVGLGDWVHAGYLGTKNPGQQTEFAQFIELVGPGACWLDADLDGLLDLYLVNGRNVSHPERDELLDPRGGFFRNLGDGTFDDISAASGTDIQGVFNGCAAGDHDNDGDADLAVFGWGELRLFESAADGTFADVTDAAGLGGSPCSPWACWSASGSWFDPDRDGCLDLLVTNYAIFDPDDPPQANGPTFVEPQRNLFYEGDCAGSFTERAADVGIDRVGHSWSSVASDLDNDGWPDVYISNDGDPNDVYINDGDGTFTWVPSVASDPRTGMGTAVGDLDNNGWHDIITTNFVQTTNGLFFGTGTGYVDRGSEEPFNDAIPYSGWAAHFFDLDRNGHLDAMIVNGLTENAGPISPAHPVLAYQNLDGEAWTSARGKMGPDIDGTWVGRGGAWADYDNDGDVDFLLGEAGEASTHLFRSELPSGNFLAIDVVGTAATVPRDAPGTRVTVSTASGSNWLEKQIGTGFLSSSDPRLHFGLGSEEAADVTVTWPDGTSQSWTDVRANQFLRATQGDAALDVVAKRPILSLQGPDLADRLEDVSLTLDVDLPDGASIAQVEWDDGSGPVVGGTSFTANFEGLGDEVVTATVTDTMGRVQRQAHRVFIVDTLSATLSMGEPRYTPLGEIVGVVHVTFSNGDPVPKAAVTVDLTYSSGNALVDSQAQRLPRFAQDALGYIDRTMEGPTDAGGNFTFVVPHSWRAPTGLVDAGFHHPGVYELVANGGAKGSVFDPVDGAFEVGTGQGDPELDRAPPALVWWMELVDAWGTTPEPGTD